MKRILAGLAVVGMLMVASPAQARPAAASIQIDQASPVFGDSVTFTTSVPAKSQADAYIYTYCNQNGALVWVNSHVALDGTLVLGAPGPGIFDKDAWNGGAAECVSEIRVTSGTRTQFLAYTQYHVGA